MKDNDKVPELDLTQEEGCETPQRLKSYELRDYHVARTRESARSKIGYVLIGLLVGLVATTALGPIVLPAETLQCFDRVMTLVFPAVVGLVGTVIGFYFGSGGSLGQRESGQER
jgi:hypothetical protein